LRRAFVVQQIGAIPCNEICLERLPRLLGAVAILPLAARCDRLAVATLECRSGGVCRRGSGREHCAGTDGAG